MKIAIIGLGYVGLPLAVEFGKRYETLGFDINQSRVDDLNQGIDHTLEVETDELKQSTQLTFSNQSTSIVGYDFYIVTVPTPINKHNQPDLNPANFKVML